MRVLAQPTAGDGTIFPIGCRGGWTLTALFHVCRLWTQNGPLNERYFDMLVAKFGSSASSMKLSRRVQ
jgi:hypothetical protein